MYQYPRERGKNNRIFIPRSITRMGVVMVVCVCGGGDTTAFMKLFLNNFLTKNNVPMSKEKKWNFYTESKK